MIGSIIVHLNFTVILLIFTVGFPSFCLYLAFKFHCDSINIATIIWRNFFLYAFKFHCDSININCNYRDKLLKFWFKFHCDSINILGGHMAVKSVLDLNFTVILLISCISGDFSSFHIYLNFTVILLIFPPVDSSTLSALI